MRPRLYMCCMPMGSTTPRPTPDAGYAGKVTDYPATYGAAKVMDGMKNGDPANGIAKMKDNDTLLVWTFDHGGGGQDACLCLYGGEIWIPTSRTGSTPCPTRPALLHAAIPQRRVHGQP